MDMTKNTDNKTNDDIPKNADDMVHPSDSLFTKAKNKLTNKSDGNIELQKEIDALKNKLAEADKKALDNWDRLMRKESELQNLQRRSKQDLSNAHNYAIEKFSSELLDVVESFERGFEHVTEESTNDLKSLIEGQKLTYKLLVDVLAKHGIEEVNPIGKAFDPKFHEAMSCIENADIAPNHVITVVQKGYILNNRLLRPARVLVSRAVATDNANSDAAEK